MTPAEIERIIPVCESSTSSDGHRSKLDLTTDIADGINSTRICVLVLINPVAMNECYQSVLLYTALIKHIFKFNLILEAWSIYLLDVVSSLLLRNSRYSELKTVHKR